MAGRLHVRRWWQIGVLIAAVLLLAVAEAPGLPAQQPEAGSAIQEDEIGSEPNPRDVTHDDDVIVKGSLCAGDSNDCADGEAFTGFGPSNFQVETKLKDNNPSLGFEDTNSTAQWAIAMGSDNRLAFQSSGAEPFTVENGAGTGTLVVADTSRVGVGTAAPEDTLEVAGSGGVTRLLVNEESGVVNQRFLLELRNNGAPRFKFVNAATGREWQFSQSNIGDFLVSFVGSGGPELIIKRNGQVQMGPGPVSTFVLDPSGNLFIDGTLTQGSDASDKTAIAAVDAAAILDMVAGLEITEWSYRHTPGVRHVGPMAQDFAAAFGYGATDTGIAAIDADGVALAAIQALAEENAELREANERLESTLDDVLHRLDILEAPRTDD